MALIKSISGFRGTIGGQPGDNLTPIDIVECTAAYGLWLLRTHKKPKVIVGRDARISGKIVSRLVCNTLLAQGIDVVDLGLSTTPTVEVAVPIEKASGGIILTASHNPKQWNALKLLNDKGEFISAQDGKDLLDIIDKNELNFAEVDDLGTYTREKEYMHHHIDAVLAMDYVDKAGIANRKFKVVVDCINSTGSISIVPLLKQMGCEVIALNDDLSGNFAHNPEPIPAHLIQLSETVIKENADLGITVDPDVDRLAFVSEDGSMFGEEYTLVAVADYLLSKKKGNTVSNLSSTRALRDVSEKHGVTYSAAAVGEVNVVTQMKKVDALIGGEGNGGIIYPGLHYGRDALVGVVFFLSLLVEKNMKMTELKATYPAYEIVKDKIQLEKGMDLNPIFAALDEKYADQPKNTIDGLKIEFGKDWVHLRKSNTEPIIRVIAESKNREKAQELADNIKNVVVKMTQSMV